MIARRPASGQHKVAQGRGEAVGQERVTVGRRAQAHRRLRHLYEVSKLLAVFDDIEKTVHTVLATMARTLPLRSAVLLLGSSERPRTFAWRAKGLGENGLRLALAHAEAAYPYLVGSPAVVLRESTTSVNEIAGDSDQCVFGSERPVEGFILLPLVVDHFPIFGALQVEGAARLDESDLEFVNSVVNQLAVAIDRHAAIQAAQAAEQAKRRDAEEKRAQAEQAAKEQHFLSELSAALASSLQYRDTLETCARLSIPFFADVCVIDEVAEDGSIGRLETRLVDVKTAKLAKKVGGFAPSEPGWQAASVSVLETGQPILISDFDASSIHAQHHAHLEGMRASGLRSIIVAPLIARGRSLGVLSFATAESGRRYGPMDLALALEVARRTAMAMDNSMLHEETKRAVEQRQDILAIVSHDLRNPLSAILAVTHLLLRAPAADRAIEDQTRIRLIRRTAERMDRLIKDLLDLSSLEAGHLSIDTEPIALGVMFADALEILRPNAETKSLRIDALITPEELRVHCDRARVVRVLLNLVGNAIKFTAPGGTIRMTAERQSTTALIKITDTGPGIATERLTHVFERYWQAHETASGGTGLGLYISKRIVEAHGGSIWAESTAGTGSTFFFTLPLSVAAPPLDDR